MAQNRIVVHLSKHPPQPARGFGLPEESLRNALMRLHLIKSSSPALGSVAKGPVTPKQPVTMDKLLRFAISTERSWKKAKKHIPMLPNITTIVKCWMPWVTRSMASPLVRQTIRTRSLEFTPCRWASTAGAKSL